jgi:hypothetical protein
MGAASLPSGAGESGADRLDQAAVGVEGHQPDTGEAAGGQVAEERQPAVTTRRSLAGPARCVPAHSAASPMWGAQR